PVAAAVAVVPEAGGTPPPVAAAVVVVVETGGTPPPAAARWVCVLGGGDDVVVSATRGFGGVTEAEATFFGGVCLCEDFTGARCAVVVGCCDRAGGVTLTFDGA